MENIDPEQQLLENNLDGEVNNEGTEELHQQDDQVTNEQTAQSMRSASSPAEATKQLSDYLLTQIISNVDK